MKWCKKWPEVVLYLLSHIDTAKRCDVAVFVFSEHFAHGAGRRLTGQAVDVDLLLLVFFTHQPLLLLWLHVHKPGSHINKVSTDHQRFVNIFLFSLIFLIFSTSSGSSHKTTYSTHGTTVQLALNLQSCFKASDQSFTPIVKWSEVEWREVNWNEVHWSKVKWAVESSVKENTSELEWRWITLKGSKLK